MTDFDIQVEAMRMRAQQKSPPIRVEYVRSILSDFEAGKIETARQKVKKYISHLEKFAR